MTNRLRRGGSAGLAVALLVACGPAGAAGPTTAPAAAAGFPFEGTWIRADRTCSPKATVVRSYTAHEVVSSRNRCTIHRIAGGYGTYELFEECHHAPNRVTETIHMGGPDAMSLKRQVVRLKIPRAMRFARCNAATPSSSTKGPPPPAKK